jgi:hypothetical protein
MGFQILVVMGLYGAAATDVPADELLAKCEAALDVPRQIMFDAETLTEWTDGDPQSQPTRYSLSRCVFRRDGQRFQADATSWFLDSGNSDTTHMENRTPYLSYRAVWADGRYFHHQRATGDGRPEMGTTSAQPDYALRHMMASLKDAKAVEGYLLGDDEIRWTTILRKAARIDVAPDREKVDDAPCIHMQCRTANGAYSVWIDPAMDYRARKIEVVRTSGDLLSGKPLTEYKSPKLVDGKGGVIREHHLIVENVRFEKIGEQWIPVGVQVRDSIEYTNGVFHRSSQRQTRKNIKVDAGVIRQEAFAITDAPENLKFFDQDEKEIIYVFQNGRFARHALEGAQLVPKP